MKRANIIKDKMKISSFAWGKIKTLAKRCTYEDDVSRMELGEELQPHCNKYAKTLAKDLEQLRADDDPIVLSWPLKLGIKAGVYRFGKDFFPVIQAGGCEDSGFEDGWESPVECFSYALCQALTYHLSK
jgi:hypothetical protein